MVGAIAQKTVDIVTAHWATLLNTTLTAVVTAIGIWFTGVLTPPAPSPRTVEVIKTVPDAGSTGQRLAAIEAKIDACTAAIEKARSEIMSKLPEKKAPKKKPIVVGEVKK